MDCRRVFEFHGDPLAVASTVVHVSFVRRNVSINYPAIISTPADSLFDSRLITSRVRAPSISRGRVRGLEYTRLQPGIEMIFTLADRRRYSPGPRKNSLKTTRCTPRTHLCTRSRLRLYLRAEFEIKGIIANTEGGVSQCTLYMRRENGHRSAVVTS